MTATDSLERAQTFESLEAIPSLDRHGEVIRLILTEASLLSRKYRNVRRHDVPHIREMTGLLDLLWQEVDMNLAEVGVVDDPRSAAESLPLFGGVAAVEGPGANARARPAFRLQR